MKYIDKHWRKKIGMWCAANRNVPHAGQNTNVGIESFYANLKRILLLEKQRLAGRRLDWLADDLKNKVTGHYWSLPVITEPVKNQSEERQRKMCRTEGNPIIIESALPLQNRSKQDDHAELIRDLLSTAKKHVELHNHLVADLKNIRGRYRKMITRGIACKEVKETTPTFPLREGDWSLKRKLGRLEVLRANKRCRA
jgi:hypothetical protein